MLASITTAEYLGAEELAPKAKLQKNKINMALMPEITNRTGLPQILHRSSPDELKDNIPFDSRTEILEIK